MSEYSVALDVQSLQNSISFSSSFRSYLIFKALLQKSLVVCGLSSVSVSSVLSVTCKIPRFSGRVLISGPFKDTFKDSPFKRPFEDPFRDLFQNSFEEPFSTILLSLREQIFFNERLQ